MASTRRRIRRSRVLAAADSSRPAIASGMSLLRFLQRRVHQLGEHERHQHDRERVYLVLVALVEMGER